MANNKTDKSLLAIFEEKMQRIADSTATGIDAFETEDEKARRIARLLKDYEAFARFYFPDYCKAPMGWFHKRAFAYLHRKWNIVALLQWSREFAKSTHANLLYPAFLYYNGKLDGMMCGSANEDLAMLILSDLKINFEVNQRLLNDFGDRRSAGNWTEDKFVTSDNIGFIAFGRGQSPRGTRFRSKRPNYGTIDDLQDRKSLKNDKISQEDYEWVKEDFMPALHTKQWQLVVPQNKFHKNCVTAKFEADPEIKAYVSKVNMLDEKGQSNWKEYLPTEVCKAKIKSIGHLSSQREYFNNPIEEGTIFTREMTAWVKRLPFSQYDYLVAYSDPSYKNNQKSDYKATVLLGRKGIETHVLKVFIAKCTIREMFLWHYLLDDMVGDPGAIQHWMEANFIQDMHLKVLEPLTIEKGRRLRLSGDTRSKPDKYQRISSLQPLFENGLIKFSLAEKTDPHMLRLIDQFLGFEKGSNLNDDGPDAVEGGYSKLDGLVVSSQPPIYMGRQRSKYAY